MKNLNKNDRILILGHKGLVGSSIFRHLKKLNYNNIIGASKKDITRHLKIDELNAPIDLAISATCSKPRYSILLDLIEAIFIYIQTRDL